jgi:UDP-glucuronate decarboxylase
MDNNFTGSLENIAEHMDNNNFKFIKHDVIQPIFYSMIDNTGNTIIVDQIYHLACPASPPAYQLDPIKTIKTNVYGTMNVLDYANKCNARVLFSSTSEVYGDPQISPQVEEYWGNVNPIGPRSCYDEGKRIAETIMMEHNKQNNTTIRIARIFNTYGPKMDKNDGRVVSNFINQCLEGKDITIYGDGSQIRDWIYVEDHVAGLIKACFEGSSGETYNIGSSNEIRNIDTVQIICNILDDLVVEKPRNISSFHNLITFVDDRPGHDQRYAINSSKIMSELNWKNLQTFDSGINITIRWYLDNQKWWQEILEKNYSFANSFIP